VVVVGWLAACMSGPPSPVADPLGADALYDAAATLTRVGPRQVATPGEELARAGVAAGFRAASGVEPVDEPFVYDAWRPGTASITVNGETWPVEALSPSPQTDVELPLATDGDLAGTAAILSSDDGARAESFIAAATSGAAALIRVTDQLDFDASPLVEVGHLLDGSTFPAVAVDQPTGDRLRQQVGSLARLDIAPDIALQHTSFNVVARLPGREDGDQQVFVVAHYDSWHPSESAFDNALGVGALLQLATRAFAEGPPLHEVVFLATSAEEQGLKGANAWVADHADEVGPGDVVIVLDVMWSAEGTYLALATGDELLNDALDATREAGLPAEAGGDPGLGSDHVPFVLQGADAIWIGRWPDRHYHTVADTLDALDFADAARALEANWSLLAKYAGLTP
jgi:aminopeptidase YwaD